MRKVIINILLVLLFFQGCGYKYEVLSSKSYKIVVKNRDFAISDMGFLNITEYDKIVDIFSAGVAVLHVRLLKDEGCINGYCTDRLDFNRRFLGYRHYKNILDEILMKRPIYEKAGYHKLSDGFEQIIKDKNYSIIYRVNSKEIYYKDKKNHILIKLKRM